jgi:uncharacterized protein
MSTHVREAPSPQLQATARKSPVYKVFVGSHGLRPGWGCALFVVTTLGFTFLFQSLAAPLLQGLRPCADGGRTAAHLALDRILQLIAVLISTCLMARLEKRPMQAYGFSRERFLALYVQGAAIGITGLSVLLLIYLAGGWRIDGLNLHGGRGWSYGLAWALAFIFVAFSEESQMRGYLLATLSRGITFWPAAVSLSLLFAALHLGNGGENYAGIVFAALAGVAFSYMIWRTGSLSLVFGLHAAWDWGESFLYGTPDSGQHVCGYLLQSHPLGNPLVSGGSAGPEGSVLGLPVLLLMVIAVHFASPRVNRT